MPKSRKNMPDQQEDLEKEIQRQNENPGGQENRQQDQGGHFGGQHEKGRPFDPARER